MARSGTGLQTPPVPRETRNNNKLDAESVQLACNIGYVLSDSCPLKALSLLLIAYCLLLFAYCLLLSANC